MFTLRRCGGSEAMSSPRKKSEPASGVSNPAMMRRVVVLPSIIFTTASKPAPFGGGWHGAGALTFRHAGADEGAESLTSQKGWTRRAGRGPIITTTAATALTGLPIPSGFRQGRSPIVPGSSDPQKGRRQAELPAAPAEKGARGGWHPRSVE